MVLAGQDAPSQLSQEVAELTMKCLLENVPAEPRIAFLSGGQSDIDACKFRRIK